MSEPFIGELRLFGFNFPPQGWAECNGQLLPINQNTALFSLLGTTYGGDGETTFALPDLRGRANVHKGSGPGLPNFQIGSNGGEIDSQLTVANLPAHNHPATLQAAAANADQVVPNGQSLAVAREDTYAATAPSVPMAGNSVTTSNVGSNQEFTNLQPYLTLNWCIALTGIFPSQ